jgi:hypothetical protein
MSVRLSVRAVVILALFVASAGFTEVAAEPKVTDLAWMTGSWVGPFGEQTLEENWNQPAAGTIACLVRITGDGQMRMLELILIEEVDDSLLFRVRQWLPGYVPRREEVQLMTLAEIGDRRVSFDGVGDSDFKRLTYSRPTEDSFQIDVKPRQGDDFQIVLRERGEPD